MKMVGTFWNMICYNKLLFTPFMESWVLFKNHEKANKTNLEEIFVKPNFTGTNSLTRRISVFSLMNRINTFTLIFIKASLNIYL